MQGNRSKLAIGIQPNWTGLLKFMLLKQFRDKFVSGRTFHGLFDTSDIHFCRCNLFEIEKGGHREQLTKGKECMDPSTYFHAVVSNFRLRASIATPSASLTHEGGLQLECWTLSTRGKGISSSSSCTYKEENPG